MRNKLVIDFIIRYSVLLLLGLENLYVIYLIFTPLTIYSVFYILNLSYNATLTDITIILGSKSIMLIPACIAGVAYYFLLILNLTTPMKLKKRIYSLIFILSSFLILNILRIIVLSVFFINSFSLFDTLHKLTWYFVTTVFVVGIWFINVKIFSIDKIPLYSDIKLLIKESKL